jgi:hypothetical protein
MLQLTDFGQLKDSELEPVDLTYRIGEKGSGLSKFATRLSTGIQISELFRQAPPKGYLHVIVDVPPAGEYGSFSRWLFFANSVRFPTSKSTACIKITPL